MSIWVLLISIGIPILISLLIVRYKTIFVDHTFRMGFYSISAVFFFLITILSLFLYKSLSTNIDKFEESDSIERSSKKLVIESYKNILNGKRSLFP